MAKHQKHPPLLRSTIGSYHRSEWAIYGSDCASIALLFNAIQTELSGDYELAYIDADHNNEPRSTLLQTKEKQFHFNSGLTWNEYDDKLLNWPVDSVIVNGNHYPAKNQIVIIDNNKKDSLKRRISQLSKIDLVLLKDEPDEIFDFIKEKITSSTPVLKFKSTKAISDWFRSKIAHEIPELKALILAGGESKRMQEDKSKISYHGQISQVKYLADMTSSLGLQTFISKAHDVTKNEFEGYPIVKDKFIKLGPFGAISSAFMQNPNVAYLVLACDLPFVTKESLSHLIDSRSSSNFATSYKLKSQTFPEPLLSIYEPKIYQRMLRLLSLGYACPRKVLINSAVKIVDLKDKNIAFNANTPEDRDLAISQLRK
jgi:molybdopterin-guanine dinucleotide biosynthesis protein A